VPGAVSPRQVNGDIGRKSAKRLTAVTGRVAMSDNPTRTRRCTWTAAASRLHGLQRQTSAPGR
jgi:hypothetical protein